MADWKFSVGNLVSRAASDPAAVAPAVADSLLPLTNLGSGYPDEQGGLTWRSDGTYDIDFDLNLLAATSDRADAPTGWADLMNLLAGTPGLPALPPDWGTYAGRTALRLYRPVYQDIEVMPGETVTWEGGIYRPAAAVGATGIVVRIEDLSSGKYYDATYPGWRAPGGSVDEQLISNAWQDTTVTIAADTAQTERRTYRVIVSPAPATYDATTYVYVSAKGGSGSPALFASVDLVALIGHNLPAGATVELQPQPAGTTLALTPTQPSCYTVGVAAQAARTWRLSIDIPSPVYQSARRPILGEVWIGKARTLTGHAPTLPYTLTEGDASQVRVEGTGGRVDVLGSGVPARAEMALSFTFDAASYRQGRDEVARLTAFGEEPLLLLPSSGFEGAGRVYHGRIGQEVAYSRLTPPDSGDDAQSLRTFTWEFSESPLAAP